MKQISSETLLVILGVVWLIFGGGVYLSSIIRPAPVVINWSTETEFETAGFNIYRSDTLHGEYKQVNPQLVPGQADAATGASYSWEDKSATVGESYFYQLEDVEYNNTRTRHDPFEYKAGGISMLKLAISVSGLLLGLALIVYSRFEKNSQKLEEATSL